MKRRSNCSISCALEILGDRWTLLLLRDMLLFNKSLFCEFLESPERISTNILTDRLHKMESAKLITRELHCDYRNRHAYYLTEQGRGLVHVMEEIAKWRVSYCKEIHAKEPRSFQ